jgi:hypothetical protein
MKLSEIVGKITEEALPAHIARAARDAGYTITGRSLDDLRKEYAKRSTTTEYADQFDARLGELLGLSRKTKAELEELAKE